MTLDVLLPGAETMPVRHHSTQVNFCIRGSGRTLIGAQEIAFKQYDVWNHPSYRPYRHVNDGKGLQARLTYSNAPLLEMLRVHLVNEDPPLGREVPRARESSASDCRLVKNVARALGKARGRRGAQCTGSQ